MLKFLHVICAVNRSISALVNRVPSHSGRPWYSLITDQLTAPGSYQAPRFLSIMNALLGLGTLRDYCHLTLPLMMKIN